MSSAGSEYSSSLSRAIQRLDALIDWERGSRLSMRIDLAPVSDLLDRLGKPQERFRSIHVTGTKGKGSVCSLIAAGLREAGLRVGRYSSPHLEKVNERIHVDGAPISDDLMTSALSSALDARDQAVDLGTPGAQATWFDVMTAAAFIAFEQADVEWAVVEVGIGGRRDSTNVVPATISVITNIGLEHTDVLGSTIEAIAAEKAGIVKRGTTLVTPIAGTSREGEVIFEEARRCDARVRQVESPPQSTITQVNIATARAVLDELGQSGVLGRIDAAPLGRTLLSDRVASGAAVPGRMERFEIQGPPSSGIVRVVLDGAHVDFALTSVVRELQQSHELAQRPVVLLALGGDKDAEAMLDALRPIAARLVCVTLGGGRPSWPADKLMSLALSRGIAAEVGLSPQVGLQRCLALSLGTWVLVTGSLHLVGALRGELVRRK